MSRLTPYLKAIYGTFAAALTALVAVYMKTGHVTWGDVAVIVVGALGSLAVIWGVPNAPKPVKIAGSATINSGSWSPPVSAVCDISESDVQRIAQATADLTKAQKRRRPAAADEKILSTPA